jgi:hypothetical protein
MARFYCEVWSDKGKSTTSRTGNKRMECHIRGWNIGVQVNLSIVDGRDMVRVYKTFGSNASGCEKLLAQFQEKESDANKT